MIRFAVYQQGTPAARALVAILAFVCVLAGAPRADAQGTQLVPLVTDQTPLALSTKFGVPVSTRINNAGDVAIIGRGGSAILLKRAGSQNWTRVIQAGDEIPGLTGSRMTVINGTVGPLINTSGQLAFAVDLFPATGAATGAVLLYDGSALRTIAHGLDIAPGSGGTPFGRSMSTAFMNDAGQVLFGAINAAFLGSASGAPIRVAGVGDPVPGIGGTFTSVAVRFNNVGDVIVRGAITGGSAASAIFKWTPGSGFVKVVAEGEAKPGGGVFGPITFSLLNDAGDVVFLADSAYWRITSATGISRIIGTGDPVPLIGGTFGTLNQTVLFNNAGDFAVTAAVTGGSSNFGFFRVSAANAVDVVAYRGQTAQGTSLTFDNFVGMSLSNTGTIGFRGVAAGGAQMGVYTQAGSAAPFPVAIDNQVSPLGGTYDLGNASVIAQVLDSGAMFFSSDVFDGSADHGAFLASGGSTTTIFSTADALPTGGRAILSVRTFGIGAAGDFVAFIAQLPGGAYSLVRHQISATASAVVATEGTIVPGTGGRLRLSNINVAYIGANGHVVMQTTLIGGAPLVRSAILVGTPAGLQKVAVDGETDSQGRVLGLVLLPTGLAPSPINTTGQILFSVGTVGGLPKAGLYIGKAGFAPVKAAEVGDPITGGRAGETVNGFAPTGLGTMRTINNAGQLAFYAQTRRPLLPGEPNAAQFRTGLYVVTPATPATPSVKILQIDETAPGSAGTFSDIATPAFNSSGVLAFNALLTGGSGGGIFTYDPAASPSLQALVQNGDPSPAGGTFVFSSTLRPDVILNDQHDLVFLADLTGGPADSAYFMRRGPTGALQVILKQGDPAPGTSGNFTTLQHTLNGVISEFNQLSDLGDVSIRGASAGAAGTNSGYWHVTPNNTVQELLVRGQVAQEFGGGAAVLSSQISQWNSGSRYSTFVRTTGGNFVDGIFLYVPVPPTPTGTGTNVTVTPLDATTLTAPVSMTFDDVTSGGETSVVTSAGGPTLPSAFSLGNPPVYVNISTTATFTGSITVCVDIATLSFPPGAPIRLLHFENGFWTDVTSSGPTNGIICGTVTSLSPFAVVSLTDAIAPTISVTVTPTAIFPPNDKLITVTATITVSDNIDPSPRIELVSITSNEPLVGADVQGAAFGTDDRSFQLRARRADFGPGRTYTITYRATDAAGNSTLATATVFVGHDRRR
jgi:hypothetical protein